MPTLTGWRAPQILSAERQPNIAPAMDAYLSLSWPPPSIIRPWAIWFGAPTRRIGLVLPAPIGGHYGTASGGELFDKIIVTPRILSLGFVLADVLFTVDIWNTHRTQLKRLSSVQISGPGGMLLGGVSLPRDLGPFGDVAMSATVPRDGDAVIACTAVFTFVPPETGADVVVAGSRIVVFSPDPDWQDGIREKTQYRTAILHCFADVEQRIQLRKHPRTALGFTVRTINQLDTAVLTALLWGWQARIFAVPFWPDAKPLTIQANSGDRSVAVSPVNTKIVNGSMLMLWRDSRTCEAANVLTVLSASAVLAAPLSQTWPADGRTYVVPLLPGRLTGEPQVTQDSGAVADVVCDFQCEVV